MASSSSGDVPPTPQKVITTYDEFLTTCDLPTNAKTTMSRKSNHDRFAQVEKMVREAADRTRRLDPEQRFRLLYRAMEIATMIRNSGVEYEKFIKSPSTNGRRYLATCNVLMQELEALKAPVIQKYSELEAQAAAAAAAEAARKEKEEREKREAEERARRIQRNSTTDEYASRLMISPKDLVRFVEKDQPKRTALIIDFREEQEDKIKYPKGHLISVVNVQPDTVKEGMIYSHMHDRVAVGQRAWLSRLTQVDFVVIMDDKGAPVDKNGEIPVNSRYKMVQQALTAYNPHLRPKQAPLIMEGGFENWREQYPPYVQCSEESALAQRSLEPLDSMDEVIRNYRKNTLPTLGNIQYPSMSPQSGASPQRPPQPSYNGPTWATSPSAPPPLAPPTLPPQTTTVSVDLPGGGGGVAVVGGAQGVQRRNGPLHETHFSAELGDAVSTTTRMAGISIHDVRPTFPGQPGWGGSSGGPAAAGFHPTVTVPVYPSVDRTNKPEDAFSSVAPSVPQRPPQANGVAPRLPQLDRSLKPARLGQDEERHLLLVYDQMIQNMDSGSRKGGGRPGVTGLFNMGNTCFMNATLQCLAQTPQLRHVFTRGKFLEKVNIENRMGTTGVISAVFSALMDAMWSGSYHAIRPQRFLRQFASDVNETLADGQQHDAQEFQLFLLDALHEDTNEVSKRVSFEQNYTGGEKIVENARDYADRSRRFAHSPVNDIFNMQTVSELECGACRQKSATFEESSLISLELPQLQTRTSLADCLRMHFSQTRLDGDCQWNCPRCKRPQNAIRTTQVWRTPPILVIHFKRFSVQNGEYVKNNMQVDFPVDGLDISMHSHPRAPRVGGVAGGYRLYAVTIHRGRLNSGHYTAIASHAQSGEWIRFDDESSIPMNGRDIDTSDAFMLYYKRV